MLVLLELRIVVGRKHLAMGIDVDARAFGLDEEIFDILQVVTGDEDARIAACADVHPGEFRITVCLGVGLVEECHHIHAVLSCFEHHAQQRVHISIRVADGGESTADEADDFAVLFSQMGCVLVVCRHTLQAEHGEFLERADICILVAEHGFTGTLSLIVCLLATPGYLLISREVDIHACRLFQQQFLQYDALIYLLQDILVVEVGVGDGGEECIREEMSYLWCRFFAYAMLYGSYATNHAEQQILPLGSCSLLTANTLDGTACTLSCFLTLETEHLVFCHIAIN